MNDFSDILAPEAVVSVANAANRKSLFGQLGQLAEDVWRLEAREVTDLLLEREKLVSTGCGAGIAIPHARPHALDRVVAGFVRLEQAIDFDSVDDLPVDLVFLLLSPRDAGAEHLKALARVSRALRDRAFTEKLRGAGSHDALYALLCGLEARDAA